MPILGSTGGNVVIADLAALLTTQDNLFLLFYPSIDENLKRSEYYDSFLFYLLC